MNEDKDARALTLFLAATPLEKIRDQMRFASVTSAQAAINRALRKRERAKEIGAVAKVEAERLDSIYRALYPQAIQGDVAAIDRCLKIGEQRMRLIAENHGGQLLASYEATIKALTNADADGIDCAAVEAGRAVARQIDFAIKHGTGQDVTKALYLLPHLMNVLKELGATPQARSEMNANAHVLPSAASGVSSLDAFRREMEAMNAAHR